MNRRGERIVGVLSVAKDEKGREGIARTPGLIEGTRAVLQYSALP